MAQYIEPANLVWSTEAARAVLVGGHCAPATRGPDTRPCKRRHGPGAEGERIMCSADSDCCCRAGFCECDAGCPCGCARDGCQYRHFTSCVPRAAEERAVDGRTRLVATRDVRKGELVSEVLGYVAMEAELFGAEASRRLCFNNHPHVFRFPSAHRQDVVIDCRCHLMELGVWRHSQ
eukprot:m51a1_g5727 hypothetical protein (177) ;mRNA; r:1122458-1123048